MRAAIHFMDQDFLVFLSELKYRKTKLIKYKYVKYKVETIHNIFNTKYRRYKVQTIKSTDNLNID